MDTLSNQPDHAGPAGEEPLSIDSGIDAIESLMDPSQEEDTPTNDIDAKTEEEVTDEDSEQLETQDSDETEDTTGEGDETEEGDTEEPQETQATDEDGPLDFVEDLVVKLGEEETTLGAIVQERVDERAKSFQADYTRKTQEVAAERRTVDEHADRLHQAIQNANVQRETFLKFQEQFAPVKPDISLVETDPIAYQQQQAYYQEWHDTYSQFAQQHQQAIQQSQQEQLYQVQQNVEQEKAKMVQTVPELATEKGMAAFKKDLSEVFMPAYGYTAEELGMVTDHRFAPIARDAMAYRKLKGQAPKTQEKLKGKPPVLTPKSRKTQNKKVTAQKAKQERLAKFGSMSDGISVLEGMDNL